MLEDVDPGVGCEPRKNNRLGNDIQAQRNDALTVAQPGNVIRNDIAGTHNRSVPFAAVFRMMANEDEILGTAMMIRFHQARKSPQLRSASSGYL